MNIRSFFNFNRFKYLVIRQIVQNYKTYIIAGGALTGFLMFVGTMILLFKPDTILTKQFLGLIMPNIFIGGYILTSMSFSELNSSHRGYLYLTLPASNFEKLLSSWFITSIGYLIFSTVFMYLLNIYYIAIASFFTTKIVPFNNVFSSEIMHLYGIYLVTQSVFFLGAIYFRRVNFLKTILALFIVVVFIALFISILSKTLFFTSSFSKYEWVNQMDPIKSKDYLHFAKNDLPIIAKTIFWGLTAPFFLVVSYYRLKEREV